MIEIEGNIWDYYGVDNFVVCIPVNSQRDSRGLAIMGAGLALEAKLKIKGIATELGLMLKYGNDVHSLDQGRIRSFPTKYRWKENASLALIQESVYSLGAEARGSPDTIFVMTRVGCGLGKLRWEEVKPILEQLPDNCWVVSYEA